MRLLPPPGPERTRAMILGLVLVGLVAWVWWPPADGAAVPAATPASAARGSLAGDLAGQPVAPVAAATQSPAAGMMPVRVRLDELARDPGPVDVGRNLFRFGERPAPPPPPPAPVVNVPAAPPPPPPPSGPPPVPLRLTGRLERPGGSVVVTLKDTVTGAIFQAAEGEIVDGRYRLIKIGVQSVVVAYVDGSGQRTIALGGGL